MEDRLELEHFTASSSAPQDVEGESLPRSKSRREAAWSSRCAAPIQKVAFFDLSSLFFVSLRLRVRAFRFYRSELVTLTRVLARNVS
jgi:hypothetical protein